MIKRPMAWALLSLVWIASACAPALQTAGLPEGCVTTANAGSERSACTPAATAGAEAQEQDAQEQHPQEPNKKTPPPGPGKKDFTTWMVLLTMGFGALYLMAFK